MTGTERSRILHRAVAILRERNDELARLEVQDTGKPIAEAIGVDVASGADCIEFFAAAAATLHGEYHDLGGAFVYTRREPLGVCAAIGAWNYPIQIACWKSAPALAAGNAMVFKPSELTPLTAMELAAVYAEAGLPPGVFNVVQGDGRVGAALAEHAGIAKISLTGSVPTGVRVMAAAAPTLKAVTLELGGKSPLVVFDDADLDHAVSAALLANFYTQGEICSNGTRVFVHRDVHDRFVEALRSRDADGDWQVVVVAEESDAAYGRVGPTGYTAHWDRARRALPGNAYEGDDDVAVVLRDRVTASTGRRNA